MKTLHTIYTNFAKRLVMSLMVLMTVGVGGVFAQEETVTFGPSDFSGQGTSGTGSSISATKDGVTFSCDKGYGTTQFRCYKDGKITISSSKTISSISFSFSGSYTGGLETSYTGLNTYSWEKSLNSQARITSCTVTYTTSGGDDGDDSGCITLSTTQNYPFNSTNSSNTSVYSTEIDGVTFENKGGYKYNSYLSFNKSLSGAYLANTTAFSGNIESIVVNYNTGGTTYFTMYEGSSSLPSSTIVSPSKTGTGEVTYTFSGNNAYFKLALTTTGQYCNINSITICCSTTPQTFTVTYDANGAESGDVPTDGNEYESGTAVTVLGNTGDLMKTGYRFDGWQIDKEGTVYTAGETFNITSNITLYAKWTARALTNYRTSCSYTCTDQYTFDYGGVKLCFSQVDESNEYQITDFTIPETTTNYWVGYNGYFYDSNLGTSGAKSANNQFKYLPIAYLQHSNCEESGYQGESYQYAMQGAYGKLRIYDNYPNDNLFVGFIPAGYQMRYGTGENWANFQLFGNDKVWTSEVMDITAELVAKYYYINIYSGATFNANDAGVAINHWTDGSSLISSMQRKTNNGDNWANGVSAGMRGFFRTWVDNCYANGYCHFVPTHRIVYVANWPAGATGVAPSDSYSEDVSVEESKEITLQAAPTAPAGYIFSGWYDAPSGGNLISTSYTISAGATADVTLYAQWKQIASLSWSAPTCTVTIASESNVFPTLTATPEAIKSGIKYSSSDPAVATIDANGNIILKSAGTTTIKAYYEEDGTYAAAEATYELTVEVSTNCRWEEVTIDDIEYGDEVVVGVSGIDANGEAILYMLQDPQEAANPKVYQMNVNNLMNATNLDNTLIWNIRKRDDNNDNFTIYKNGSTIDRLAFISNYGVRVGGNNADSIFTLISEKYIKSISSNEYLRMSNTSDWRHYSTNTIQSFVFYKKVCLPSNISRVTYSVGNGDTAPAEQEVENNTSITLPSIETTLTCVNFVGWTDAANDAAITSGNIYKAGDSYKVTQDITLKAVYAAGGGFVLVTDANDLAVGNRIVIVATEYDVAMGEQNTNNRAQVKIEKDDTDNTITTPNGIQFLTLEEGTTEGTFAFSTGSGYLYAASSSKNYLNTQTTNNANGSWKIEISAAGVATIKAQGSNTHNWLRYNSGSSIFSCYASGQVDVSIYKESITGYTTNPECVMYNVTLCTPANGTISVDNTIVDPYGSTSLTFAPATGYMLDAVTITSGTAEVGTVSYTSNQTSGGTVKISNIQSDIEVCATFKEIPYYKVTFVDMNNGNSTQIVSQSGFGADIQAPTTASDGCDATWTFIGWAPSNNLNGASEIPNGLVAPGGTISGSLITDNSLTYYSVYSNSSDGTPPFSIGKSGTYYFKAITEEDKVYYATGEMYSNKYRSNQETKIPFYVYYNTITKKYTIKNTLTDKYVTPTYDNGWANALQEQASSFEWNILSYSNGDFTLYEETGSINSDAKTGEYLFTYLNKSSNTRAIYFGGTYFESSGLIYDKYALYLEPASEMHYYNASSCTELVTMSFDVPADAVLTYADGYPEGYYKDSEKKTITTFPTLEYAGWTFIGWTAGTPYNDVIGEDYLNDENSSADAPTQTIYKTGVEYPLTSDVTMYPVFTKFADNEPFDMVNGGDYYIYYIADGDVATSEDEYGATNRIYAGGWGSGGTSDSYGATQSCASATLFTFTKLSNGKWSIYDNTKGKYLCAGTTDNNLALNTTTATYGEWTITVHNGNQVNAVSKEGYTLSALSQDAVTGTFKNYATSNFNNNSAYYHRVYVGTCTERVYSSNPSNKPKITLNGTATVTSTKDQTIRSAKSLTLSAVKLAANGTITLTSDNADVYFATDKTANFSKAIKPVASLTINADANGKLALTTVYVHYKPAAVPTSNLDIQTVTITATTGTDGQPNYATATTTATVRNLPADFVIAAKVNDIWYALPNNCNSTSIVNGLPIDVDDPINPTSATFAPAEAKWGLKPVYTTSGANDRYADYGEYFVFAETNTGTAGLLYSNKDNAQVQTQGTYSGISGYQEISRYEWIPTTTNLITYQLAGAQDSKQLNINVNGVFGTHSQLVAENELRLLPIVAIYQHAEVQVVEWRADAVVFMYTGDPNHSVTTTLASTSTTKSLSEIKFDHGVYKMPVSNLLSNASKTMCIKFHDGSTEVARTEITIPVIINGETNTSSLTALAKADYETIDVVILNGGKLTATEGDAAKYRFRNVTVYGGGKLVIGEGKYLSMASIILRAGGFADDGAYEYVYPQFDLQGTLTNSAGEFKYDYITDYDHWYHLVLPFAGDLGTIKYPTEFYGSNVTTSNSGSWIIKRYAGDIRATGNYSAWVDIETDNPQPTATTPGVGYIFWGAPKKVTVNGDKQRQQWGIQRISMTKGAGTAKTEEIGNKKIQGLSSHKDVANNSGKVNDQGWNLIGNPYMVNLTGLNSESLKPGKLVEVEDAAGNWTGQWKDNEDGFRYVTIPSDHFDTYTAQRMTAFTEDNPMIAGRAFFIQLEDDDAGVTFSAANRASLLAARMAANEPTTDIETGIVLSNETMQDEVNFWIKDGKTNDYEYNADYPKTPNNTNFNIYGVHAHGDLSWVATGPEFAKESMPIGYQVPAAGTYMLSISEDYYSEDLDALYVTDHALSPEVTVDLMSNSYEFSVNQAETNNTRFTVRVKLKDKNSGTTTGVDNTTTLDSDKPIKFIYNDKIYILYRSTIYDAAGKRVTTINK